MDLIKLRREVNQQTMDLNSCCCYVKNGNIWVYCSHLLTPPWDKHNKIPCQKWKKQRISALLLQGDS